MKNVISFCVWGDCKIYTYSLFENALLLPKVFPNWKMIVYHTKKTDLNVMNELSKFDYVECIEIDLPNHYRNTMLRFIAGFNNEYDNIIFRDADARLLQRDYACVMEWVNSDKDVHIIRDHPMNGIRYRICAGMWGVKKGFFQKFNIQPKLEYFFADTQNNYWTLDERFLYIYIYPLLNESNSFIHTSCIKWEEWAKDFPINAEPREKGHVGDTIAATPNASKHFNIITINHAKKRSSS
jgi:hypothetical protein